MIDLPVALTGLFVGLVVGLTGMGGGALMTPLLVLLFGMEPLAAVSSDLVASMFMKPIGALVHHRRKTVHAPLVLWLVAGSVPAAFAGVVLLGRLGAGGLDVQHSIKSALGLALLVVAGALVVRPLLLRQRVAASDAQPLPVKPLATLVVGVIGGFTVGLTSVGSGSLMMMLLLILYPTIRLSALVGTDLMQAVPLVTSAAIAHLIFGDFQLHVTASILIGSIPGIYVGARLSSRATDQVIRPLLVLTLTASALKLLGASNVSAGIACTGLAVLSVAHHSLFGQRPRAAREARALRNGAPAWARRHFHASPIPGRGARTPPVGGSGGASMRLSHDAATGHNDKLFRVADEGFETDASPSLERDRLAEGSGACYTGGMTAEERARARRRSWSGGVVTPGAHAALEREFWSQASSEQLLAAVWEMAVQHWHQEHPDGPALRLDRSVGGVRRRGG